MGSDAKEIQRTIILEFPNLIPPVWWMLAPSELTVKVTISDCGYRQRHPIFVHSNGFLALYPASPRRPKPNPTFLSPPFQVAATCTTLNIGPWEGFSVLSANYGVTWYFHMCTKPHICGKLRKLLHILLPPPQVLNIDLGKTLHIYIEHEHIINVDTLSFYLEQDKELQNTVWQQGRNYSSHFFLSLSSDEYQQSHFSFTLGGSPIATCQALLNGSLGLDWLICKMLHDLKN